jgi:AmmeMemoRadiSam system protein B
MLVREPWVAGRFYPGNPEACLREAKRLIASPPAREPLPEHPVGGVVPHAGWTYSGAICGQVVGYLAQKRKPRTIVMTGTVHVPEVRVPTTMTMGLWRTPVGQVEIDCEFAQALVARHVAEDNPRGFVREHSLEVPLPMVLLAFPDAWFVPLMVPPTTTGVELGRTIAEVGRALGRDFLLLASSDLTHYGPAYGFAPAGLGEPGLRWTKEENDRAILEAIERLDAESIVPMAKQRHNACGPAAIATVLAAARELGARRGYIVDYKTSYDVFPEGPPTNFVGYVGAVLG